MTKIKNTHAQDLIDYIRSNMNIFKKDISKPQLAKTDLMYTIRFLYNNRIKELFYFMLNHNIKIQPDDSNFIGDKKWLIDELI